MTHLLPGYMEPLTGSLEFCIAFFICFSCEKCMDMSEITPTVNISVYSIEGD